HCASTRYLCRWSISDTIHSFNSNIISLCVIPFFHSIFMIFFFFFFFFFNDTATTEIYTLSLHDALPICSRWLRSASRRGSRNARWARPRGTTRASGRAQRSEEHTSELQSLAYLVCRLLLEKKKKKK